MVNHWVTLIGILFLFTKSAADSSCHKVSFSYIDAAVDLIAKAKDHFPARDHLSRNALDCSELLEMGYNKSGIYTVWPQSRVVEGKPLAVYCDTETDGGGWTLIQRRGPFGRAEDYFYKDWKSYKDGFGDIDMDFWLGNDNIFALTNQRLYSVRFDLKAVNNETRYAHYDKFWIDDEYSKYRLHIADYRGDAGDAMAEHHNDKFSAKGEDNDINKDRSCMERFRGGWWYKNCHYANLNGLYMNGSLELSAIHWNTWTKGHESLQATEIKIRPKNFKHPQDFINNTPM